MNLVNHETNIMKYVTYRRVSTSSQGVSGLGLEAQEYSIKMFLGSRSAEIIGEFVEIESGKNNSRPKLKEALALCKQEDATLLIAKLDRLARKASFIFNLRDSGVKFVAADMPEANTLTIGMLACLAQHEAEMISQRTKDGLAAAKRRGTKLGNPRWAPSIQKMTELRTARALEFRAQMLPVITEIQSVGVRTLGEIAHCLNVRGFKTATGRSFLPQTVCALVNP